MKEELRDIYETSNTVKMGLKRLKKLVLSVVETWLGFARIILGQVADTLSKHIQEICNYFVSKTTSGKRSEISNKIKLIIRQSYGFKRFDYLREKLLACLF